MNRSLIYPKNFIAGAFISKEMDALVTVLLVWMSKLIVTTPLDVGGDTAWDRQFSHLKIPLDAEITKVLAAQVALFKLAGISAVLISAIQQGL